jgi:hypothetical protein
MVVTWCSIVEKDAVEMGILGIGDGYVWEELPV